MIIFAHSKCKRYENRKIQGVALPKKERNGQERKSSHHGTHHGEQDYGAVLLQVVLHSIALESSCQPIGGQEQGSRGNQQGHRAVVAFHPKSFRSACGKENGLTLFLPFVTTLVRQPHYAGGRCADKFEEYTAVWGNRASLDSIAGTYNGVLPPNVETTLTLNADGTYLLIQSYNEKQNKQERLKGSFQVLDYNILMLVHPSSGDNIFYKVRDGNCIILIDSFGNEPQKEVRKNYINIIIYSRNHTNY